MIIYDDILKIPPYSLRKNKKEEFFTERLRELTQYHYDHCEEYRGMLDIKEFRSNDIKQVSDVPFLPVRLFKDLELKSITKKEVFKTLTSSGTTGQLVSKIYLDKESAFYQQKTLTKIVSSFTGASRLPMLIIDSPSVVVDRTMFSARGAGILGFSIFGRDITYALDDNMNLNYEAILLFLEKYQGKDILLFGFTFMIWQYFYKELVRLKKEGNTIDLSNGILIHGGGWKKLISESVSPKEFHNRLYDVSGLNRIHDYYGMVEQTGTIYMQCEYEHLHSSIFSDILIRRGLDFSIANIGEKGIIQSLSILPKSYPGHSLLTEDEGILLGEDDCPCGRKGKYFKVLGRLKNAEIRGCSDTYATKF